MFQVENNRGHVCWLRAVRIGSRWTRQSLSGSKAAVVRIKEEPGGEKKTTKNQEPCGRNQISFDVLFFLLLFLVSSEFLHKNQGGLRLRPLTHYVENGRRKFQTSVCVFFVE